MMLGQDGILALVKSMNGDDPASKSVGVFHLDDNGLYSVTTEKLPILTRAASNFVKIPNKPARFHAPTLYTGTKMFFGEPWTVFVDHRETLL